MPIIFQRVGKRSITLSLFIAMAIPLVSWAFPADPPAPGDIPGWNSGEIIITTLETSSENLGYWVERSYSRQTDGHSVNVIIMKGPGTVWRGLPDGTVSADDGPAGSGATYRSVRIGPHKGVMEWHPLTGRVIVVELAPGLTATFETVHDDVPLEWFARVIIEGL